MTPFLPFVFPPSSPLPFPFFCLRSFPSCSQSFPQGYCANCLPLMAISYMAFFIYKSLLVGKKKCSPRSCCVSGLLWLHVFGTFCCSFKTCVIKAKERLAAFSHLSLYVGVHIFSPYRNRFLLYRNNVMCEAAL